MALGGIGAFLCYRLLSACHSMFEKASDNSDVSVTSPPVSCSAVYQDDGIEEVKQKTAHS